jgi:hypothetical protein
MTQKPAQTWVNVLNFSALLVRRRTREEHPQFRFSLISWWFAANAAIAHDAGLVAGRAQASRRAAAGDPASRPA